MASISAAGFFAMHLISLVDPPLGQCGLRRVHQQRLQNEAMEERFPPPHHDPWAIVEVMRDIDASGTPNRHTRSFYFWSVSTDPDADFPYKDQTWFEIPPRRIKNLNPDHNINLRIDV
jgi:hypothetical protein